VYCSRALSSSPTMPEVDLSASRRCVRCAVCLPHCPTYAVTLDEGESPRGRLALMDAWSRGILEADEAFWGHLDRCLGCRLCEAVCPAEVPYGTLLDRLRTAERAADRPAPALHRLLRFLAARPKMLALLARFLGPARALGFRPTSRFLPPSLRPLADLVPAPLPKPWRRPAGVPRDSAAGEVALFLGCYARVLRPEPLRATLRVLAALGVSAVVPSGQTCCGALARHMGEEKEAERLAARNRRAFAEARVVLALDTGCLGSLRASLAGEGCEVAEICRFLDRRLPPRLSAGAPSSPLLLHTPCTHRSVEGDPAAVGRVLGRFGIEAEAWGQGAGCCGAAGTYGLLHPETARDLVRRMFASPPPAGSRILTTNVGCALMIGRELRRENRSGVVLHPIEILDEILSQPRVCAAPVMESSQRWADNDSRRRTGSGS
jgi:glycolate oxidase iron-sulfur subunit